MERDMNKFSGNLKRIRQEKGYTQESFAEATNMKRNTIACYETDRRECDFDTLLLFADILGCSTDELLKDSDEIKVQLQEKEQQGSDTVGVIYVLTNPSFPEYVKIGYADDVERRLQQLNRSECVPFSFRVYATYAVNSRLSDKSVHAIIDKLNPNLRAIEVVKGQKREREFYAMSAEDAYLILEAIAEINNCVDRLKRVVPTEAEKNEEKEAQNIEKENRTRSNNLTFSECQIPIGEVLQYCDNPEITCTVVDDRRVNYNGEIMYLTGVAKKILGKENGICGPRYFTYKGAKLWDIENRKE